MRIVAEIECSRCARVETRAVSKEDIEGLQKDEGDVLYAVLADGKEVLEVKFSSLCQPCCRSVRAILQQIGKKIDGLSPDRKPRKPKAEKPKEAKKEAHAQANGHTPPVDHASAIKPAAAGVART